MKKDQLTTWQLLRPHVKPLAPLFVLTAIIGMVGSAIQASVHVLLRPIFNLILFQEGVGQKALDPEAAKMAKAAGVGGEHGRTEEFFSAAGAYVRSLSDAEWLQDPRVGVLIVVLFAVLVITVAAAGMQYAFNQMSSYISLKMVISFRLKLTRHLMRLGLRYHGKRKLGDLLSRISADIQVQDGVHLLSTGHMHKG